MNAGGIGAHELDAVFDTDELGFAERMSPAQREALRKVSVIDRIVVSRDAGQIVGAAVSAPTGMTLPGLDVVPTTAIVGVAVWPTHRRQGRLASMMRHQLDDLHGRGEFMAVLTSSESRIYPRFGYGPATLQTFFEIEVRDVDVLVPDGRGQGAGCRVRIVDRQTARDSFPAVLTAAQARRAGEVARLEVGWEQVLGMDERDEQKNRFFVVCEAAGGLTGYAAYRIVVLDAPTGRRGRRIDLVELAAVDDDAYLALWSYLVNIDLMGDLQTHGRPVDDPIRFALSDYRRMRPLWSGEHTYLRLVDVGRALRARAYFAEGSIAIRVRDSMCPWNEGVYRISVAGHGDGADVDVSPIDSPADLEVDVAALGSMYLGGLRPGALRQIALVSELREGAVAVADQLFVGPEPPYCTTQF